MHLIPALPLLLLHSSLVSTVYSLSPSPRGSSCDVKPTPSLPFTLAAFQSPWPPGSNVSGSSGVSGIYVRASGGSLWVNKDNQKPNTGCAGLKGSKCPPGTETVLWVDVYGRAWMNSDKPQPVFINSATGALSYLPSGVTTFPPGANAVNFLHLGQGSSITSPIPGVPSSQYVNAGPGSFKWTGSENSYWFLCPRPDLGYQIMKYVGGSENWDACLSGIQMVALDYTGPSPAAGEYI